MADDCIAVLVGQSDICLLPVAIATSIIEKYALRAALCRVRQHLQQSS